MGRLKTFPHNTPQHTPQKPGAKTITKDTPRISRRTAAAEAKTTDIRYDIAGAMNGETFVCDVEIFIKHYLPKVEDKVLSHVLADMIKKEVLIAREETTGTSSGKAKAKPKAKSKAKSKARSGAKSATAVPLSTPTKPYDYSLKDFKPPCAGGEKDALEKNVFAPLTSICEAICEALRDVDGVEWNGYSVRMCGDNHLLSKINGCDQKIDACLTKNKDERLRVTDIMVTFEFKTIRTDAMVMKNRAQMVSHSNHAMNEDARRKFTLGITIEDGGISLWYFSRSHSAKSRAFNMVEQADLFVKIMIALFCATDEQLGFDPLVTVLDDGSFVYKFPSDGDNGKDTFYRTQGVVFHSRPLTLTGRSTRVWKVQQVDPDNGYTRVEGTKDMVLKDASMEADARTEDEIQKEMFSDIEGLGNNASSPWQKRPVVEAFDDEEKASLADLLDDTERMKDFFSCIVKSSTAEPSLPVAPEVWADPTLFPHSESVQLPLDLYQTNRPDSGNPKPSGKGTAVNPMEPACRDHFPPKKQCRYIYPDVYAPLYDIPTLGEAVDILKQCVLVLQVMFCAGWVHRDISPGNILALWDESKSKWQVKLADLEYAKKFPNTGPDSSSSIPKTGTPFFMAVEIQGQFHILPPEAQPRYSATGGFLVQQYLNQAAALVKPVVHSPQHDLESIWWIFLWLASKRVKRPFPSLLGKGPFDTNGEVPSVEKRQKVLQSCLLYNKQVRPFIPQQLARSFLVAIDVVRADLHNGYLRRNAEGRQDDIGSYSHIMSKPFQILFQLLEESEDQLTWRSVKLVTGRDSEQEEESKRNGSKKRKGADNHGGTGTNQPKGKKKKSTALESENGRSTRRTKAVVFRLPRTGPTTRSMTKAAQGQDIEPRPLKKARR
ncbi:other/FunK1 protein kinase [Coprinopsis cinerea AmutBmut pab1-1]|nr:other/FunK1 protein kinase [Coprinopsis cinerea AmutBmut pab1-1]